MATAAACTGGTCTFIESQPPQPLIEEVSVSDPQRAEATSRAAVRRMALMEKKKKHVVGSEAWRGGEWTIAAWCGDIETVSRLLGEGADLAVRNGKGSTALHLALQQRHVAVAKLLLEHGADVNTPTKKGVTPLMVAASCCTEMVEMLLAQGLQPDLDPYLPCRPTSAGAQCAARRSVALCDPYLSVLSPTSHTHTHTHTHTHVITMHVR
jgi:ankyrin repeat protein